MSAIGSLNQLMTNQFLGSISAAADGREEATGLEARCRPPLAGKLCHQPCGPRSSLARGRVPPSPHARASFALGRMRGRAPPPAMGSASTRYQASLSCGRVEGGATLAAGSSSSRAGESAELRCGVSAGAPPAACGSPCSTATAECSPAASGGLNSAAACESCCQG